MTKLFLFVVLATAAAIAHASAQFPPPPPMSPLPRASPPAAAPPVVTPKKKTTPAPGPGITGSWAGQLEQVGGTAPYAFEISITAKGAQTKYPELDCIGELTRVGQLQAYVFFFETITKGRAEKGGRCPDGTITVTRQGENLVLGWFGSVQGDIVVASGTLKKR